MLVKGAPDMKVLSFKFNLGWQGRFAIITSCRPFITRPIIPPSHHLTQWTSNQIRTIAGCTCAGKAGNVSPRPRFQRKPLVSDPGMHHGTCVKHVPWCMSGSLTCGDGENVPGISGACPPVILRIWQEAHVDGLVQDFSIPCALAMEIL